ncbi:MAG TPA: type IV pilus assembly protein PilM [Elusimicrobiota bacterium]|nr:type IV pilus assembly protein PilM [Elusimicrobiota bacterium]
MASIGDKFKKINISKLRFFKAKDLLGVDLGSTAIKIIQLKGSPGRWSLVRWAYLPLPNAGPDVGAPERKTQAVNLLKEFVIKQKKNAPKAASFSVSGNSVIVRYVKFPKMAKDDLAKTIQFEAEPYIPFSIPEVNIGFHIIGDVVDEGQKKMETILVAAKKDLIGNRLDIIKQGGLSPVVIDVDAFCIENAYDINRAANMQDTVLMVHIGASVTTMSIIEGGVSKVVRDVFIAGNTLTKAIQRNFQCDAKQAEEKKANAALLVTPEEREKAMAEENKEALQMSTVMLPVVKDLLSETHRSLDFYLSQGTDRQVTRILLSGGACRLKNLVNYFAQELHMPVEIFDPLAHVEGAKAIPQDLRPLFSIAVGLATRRDGDSE